MPTALPTEGMLIDTYGEPVVTRSHHKIVHSTSTVKPSPWPVFPIRSSQTSQGIRMPSET